MENVREVLGAIASTERGWYKLWWIIVVLMSTLVVWLIVKPSQWMASSIGHHPDYLAINKAELEIYGKVLTKVDWRGTPIDEYAAKRGDINDARRSTIRQNTNGNSKIRIPAGNATNGLGSNSNLLGRNQPNAVTEVWTSNKHIITRDRSDTYNIIEGEGLE